MLLIRSVFALAVISLGAVYTTTVVSGSTPTSAGSGPTDEPSSTDHQPLVESGRVKDPTVGYSFSLPTDWKLDSDSKPGNVSLSHPSTGSNFTVQLKPEAADLDTEFYALKLTAPFLGGKWSRVGERWTKVGKLKAGELESTRAHADGKTYHEWNLVCVQGSQALLLWLWVPETEIRAGRADLDKIRTSFEWPKK